jgi:hypothetical protein
MEWDFFVNREFSISIFGDTPVQLSTEKKLAINN